MKPIPGSIRNHIHNLWMLTVILLFVSIFTLQAQQITVTELPNQNLLPTSPVHRLIQDDDGYMWYATEGGGLCRDDGYQISVFRSPFPQFSSKFQVISTDSMRSNSITCLAEDKINRHIWFGTTQGLHYVDKNNYTVKTINDRRIRNKRITCLFLTSDGTVWASTDNGKIFRLGSEGKILKEYSCRLNGRLHNATNFHEDGKKQMRVTCSDNAVLKYDKIKDTFQKENWIYPVEATSIVEDPHSGLLYVGTWGKGIVTCKINRQSPDGVWEITENPATIKNDRKGCEVLSILYDDEHGILWSVTMDNIYAYLISGNSLKEIPTESFLSKDKKVLDIPFKDKLGNIWVPSYTPHTFIISYEGDKVSRFPINATKKITGYPVMADAVIIEDDYFWVWQGRDNITLYHPSTDRITYGWSIPNGERRLLQTEKCIEKCKNQPGIWAADESRLLHLQHNDMTIIPTEIADITDERITSLHESGKRLLVSTNKSLYALSVISNRLLKLCDIDAWTKQIATDSEGNIYLAAGEKGFIQVDADGKKKVINDKADFTCVTAAINGTIWTATSQGNLFSYDPSKKEFVNEDSNSLSGGESIKDLDSDAYGHIWILTDQYVKEYNPKNKAFHIFNSTDENIGMDYMHCVRYTDDNRISVGGMGAVCTITPSDELEHTSVAHALPIVTSVTTDQHHFLIGKDNPVVNLTPNQRKCEINFSTLDHLHASKISYAYRLKGLQDSWSYLPQGSNTAYFNHMPKGEYHLEIKATDSFGCWGEPHDVLTLHILPAWYETWWAYLLYTFLTAAVILLSLWGYRRFNRLMELHRRRKEVVLNSVEINVEEESLPAFEKEFLQKAVALVEKNISDSNYNVEHFSNDLCMSRMNLYRRLHSQTGQSPSEFMREIRLKKAAALLTSAPLSVREIAGRVGFPTPAYFSKCFKEMFGMLPSEFREKGNE